MDKFYQACFTRVGGTDRTSGWQLTNLSEDIPGKLLSVFEQRQKGNEPVGRGMPRNRDREPLCALEISCEADSVGLTRIQYGVPCYGREGLFSQGFLFLNAYELLKEPNRLLSVADENFCFRAEIRPDSAEALQGYLDRTATPPAELVRGPGWTVGSALARTGMNRSSYKKLICCLYGSWAKSAKNAVWIKTDGTDEYVRAMLYLIYAALPYSMRPKVTASTFSDARNISVIFSHELSDGCRYFDPVNGMSNVLTSNQLKRWSRMPFVTMAFEDEAPRFDVLEELLARMGDRCSQDTNMLQIACQMGLGGADADPVDQLYDFLNIPQDYNEMMERWASEKVDAVAEIITAQGTELSSDMEQLLDQRLEAAQTRELRDACYRFKAARLSRMDLEEACRYLKDNPAFDVLRENLRHTEKGLQILVEFYRWEIVPVVDDPKSSYEQLLESALLFCDLEGTDVLWRMICSAANKRAAEQARKAVLELRSGEAAAAEHTPLYQAMNDFAGFAKGVHRLEGIPERKRAVLVDALKQDVAKLSAEWTREYDKQFRQYFNPARIGEYQTFYNRDFHDREPLRYSTMLLQKYLAAPTGMIDVLLEFVEGGCLFNTYNSDGAGIRKRTQLKPENASEQKLIEQSLYSYWADTEAVRKNIWMWDEIKRLKDKPSKKNRQDFQVKDTKSFLFWERAARIRKMNPIWLMLEKGSVLLTDGMLTRSLAENDRYWTDDCLNSMISRCEACVQNGKAEAKGVLEILKKEREHRAEQLEANRKRAEKDKKERDKEARRSAKKEKQNAKQEPEERSAKVETPAAPQKTEGPSKPAEPEYKPYVKPGVKSAMDGQPGVPNKFTVDGPRGWNVPGLGTIPVVPEQKMVADVDDIDAVLDIVTPGYATPTEPVQPQEPENPAEGFADPVKVEQKKTEEENKKGDFWDRLNLWKKRRS